ncbi:tumor necrosis factor receptor superfamily member 10B-like [Guaruba guarouba]
MPLPWTFSEPCPGPSSPPEPCPGPRSPPGPPLSAPLRSLSRKMSSLLHCAPRRRCPPPLLVLLVLITEVSLGTAAAAVHRRDELHLFDAGKDEEEFYLDQNSNIYCRKCTAGTYVANHCKEQNGFSRCLPCKDNEYIEYPNDLSNCFSCRMCREDEVELSPCRATQNRQCACRNGTFCSPEHPCEMCQKCRPRCPKGEVELAPCTPSSDRRCGLPTTTSPVTHSTCGAAVGGEMATWVAISVIASVVLVILFLCLCCKRCSCHATGEHSIIPPSPRALRGWEEGPALQDEGSRYCFHLPEDRRDLSGKPCSLVVMVPGTSQPSVKPRKKLVPVEGAEPYACLRNSFYTFAQKVPHDHWKRFGRVLNLLENDIALAEKEGGLEVLIEMLRKWQEKETIDASVNTLLDTLHQISLGGVAEDIAFELVKEGSFQYEVS